MIKKNVPRDMMQDLPNHTLCSRLDLFDHKLSTTNFKRKREKMETSTPIMGRRDTCVMELDENSPIGYERSDTSDSYTASDDKIADSRAKAGLSNEMNSVVVTPPKELSPNTMDLKLALHARDIVRASADNSKVPELREQDLHTIGMAENPFAYREDGQQVASVGQIELIGVNRNPGEDPADVTGRAAVMDEMNKTPEKDPGDVTGRAVGMDEMNKDPEKDPGDVTERAAGMDGMNKCPIGGGGRLETVVRKKLKLGRRHSISTENVIASGSRIKLGQDASKDVLEAKACPGVLTPKRHVPMEVDEPTPLKKKKKMVRKIKPDPSQPSMFDILKKKKDNGGK